MRRSANSSRLGTLPCVRVMSGVSGLPPEEAPAVVAVPREPAALADLAPPLAPALPVVVVASALLAQLPVRALLPVVLVDLVVRALLPALPVVAVLAVLAVPRVPAQLPVVARPPVLAEPAEEAVGLTRSLSSATAGR